MKALEAIFNPRGVAFIGASEDESKVGGRRYRSLVEDGYAGMVYPVHLRASSMRGHRVFRSVLDVPDPVDLAVVAVPTASAPATVADCAARGIPAVAVITAGFGEIDGRGHQLEREMAAMIRASGGRMLGPNCAGLFDACSRLNLGGADVPAGGVALVSQSGNLLLDLNQHARRRGGGFSRQVTIGNAADLGGVELVAVCLDDPNTKVVLVYLEGWSANEGRALFDLACANANRKPIVLLKPGRSEMGRRAAMTHTGSLAGEERIVDAALRQCGIVRASSIGSAWDLATALVDGHRLGGDRVILLSDGGGHATILADALGLSGFVMPELSVQTKAMLAELLPPRSAIGNPVDFAGVAESDPAVIPRVLAHCLAAPETDAVVLAGHFGGYHRIGGADLESKELAAARALVDLVGSHTRPFLVHSIYADDNARPLELLRAGGIPVLRSPEAMAPLVEGLRQAAIPPASESGVPQRTSPATAIPPVRCVVDGTGSLLEPEARELLATHDIAVPDYTAVRSGDACARAVADLGPSALKLVAPGVIHRSDIGGVLLNVASKRAARAGFRRLVEKLPPEARTAARVLVTAMIEPGLEVICGALRDPHFGPVVMFGLGGTTVESRADVIFRLAPLGRNEALRMQGEIRGHALLDGYRGRPAVDRQAAAELLVRLGQLMVDCSGLAEIELNPVILSERGAQIADVRAHLHT